MRAIALYVVAAFFLVPPLFLIVLIWPLPTLTILALVALWALGYFRQ